MSALAARLAAMLGASAVRVEDAGPPVAAPDSVEGAAEALRLATRDRLRVVLAGARTHSAPAAPADFVLSAARLRRVLEYEPADQVAVVEAGVPLASLDAALALHAQRLAPDPWAGDTATVGGAIAADRSGPSRRGRGTWRDWVLGARVVHADGTVSRSGGRVVKNVAGFDLAKLWIGSFGTLAFIAEVALRVVPRPRAACTLARPCDAETAFAALGRLHDAPIAPQALLAVHGLAVPGWRPGDSGVVVRLEGRPEAVAAQVRVVEETIGACAPCAEDVWIGVRRALEPHPGARVVRLAGRPTAGRAWMEALRAHGASTALVQFGAGVAHARVPGSVDVAALGGALAQAGARFVFEPASGPPPGGMDPCARALARDTKATLDPQGVLPHRADLEADA